MADTRPIAHEEHQATHHAHGMRYVVVWIALLVLTVVTYAASRVHLPGGWHVAVALLIAIAKGALVALFFMHLWDQRGANRLVFVTSLAFVALLIGLTILDNATRFPLANPPGSAGALPWGGADRDPPKLP
ncbi:caa(3)-type oxidase, subunit IV [Anaeromyxobacter sp. K]|uniref:Caa(3)-type oxidase, subunit IV n=1 Tax=Anaeromyxobacter dehalogenans (strain ATCC BAA-258 / DSM 21875 / 2CP-1) TaxID=455488 RepID=B8JDW5_ANAD2|nr:MULTISPECIES: cytochrome C oxidase subunit IV family protein [Anaeromyxobacter]ACG72090.1 caa(3)-type oxidase, subunit IV [Anaeromyxobacter sp. K]ACL64210.1 caa(3)-type oxidase, subunit IV [Anaeromyxobacter dehalogenans 2CP-1]